MKLLLKTSLYYLLFTIPLLLVFAVVFYNVITHEVKESNNELLTKRALVIEGYLKNNDTIAINLIIKSNEAQINMLPLSFKNIPTKTVFSDTLIYDKNEKELAENSMISSFVNINNQNYTIKTWRSTLEYDELIEGISYLFSLLLFCIFLIFIGINIWISKTIWQPFYTTVDAIKKFRIANNQVSLSNKTPIKEFTDLNQSLNSMMHKMIADYNNQKRFSENASHEIQTPLAIIKAKIDLLVQSKNFDENDLKIITTIDDSCSKLIKLNKSLLLLTKISNNQFLETKEISISQTISNTLVYFEEQIEFKNIVIKQIFEDDFKPNINPDLVSILINNLIQNAIRHTNQDGIIEIEINKNNLIIRNSGDEKPLPNNVFERFQKNTTSTQSLGLGLSICKEIVSISELELQYEHHLNQHIFIISSKKTNKFFR